MEYKSKGSWNWREVRISENSKRIYVSTIHIHIIYIVYSFIKVKIYKNEYLLNSQNNYINETKINH